jgi:hypothetical protein
LKNEIELMGKYEIVHLRNLVFFCSTLIKKDKIDFTLLTGIKLIKLSAKQQMFASVFFRDVFEDCSKEKNLIYLKKF